MSPFRLRARAPLAALLPTVLLGLITCAWSVPSHADFIRTNYPTGSQPRGVAVGDLNKDGHPDIVVANQASNTVTVLLSNGSGGFGRVDYSVGAGPFSVAIGDLDGDGNPDVVTANLTGYSVSVLKGNGAGALGSRIDYPAQTSTISVAIADFNLDGKPDIVAANHADHSVSVFLGTGAGAFAAAVNYPIGNYPYAVTAGDVNGDGKPDIVATNYYDWTVTYRLGNGSGGFGSPISSPAGSGGVSSVAIGDFNADGNADLAVINSTTSKVGVLLANGPAVFTTLNLYDIANVGVAIAVGDINRDGKLDLVATNRDGNSASVLLGNGSGQFAPKTDYATGAGSWGVAIADINSDLNPDLVVANANDATVSVLIQTSATGVPTTTTLTSDINPSAIGQAVTLTATVSPNAATGSVQFREGTRSLGTAPLQNGVASLSTSSLSAGSRSLTAFYLGDATYQSSLSPALVQVVHGYASTVTVSSSRNPSAFTLSIRFTATVSAVDPGNPAPTGSVQFVIDGSNFGGPVTLAGGSANSDTTTVLTVGNHVVHAIYSGDSSFDVNTSPDLIQAVEPLNPVIVAVRDVPHDQGGKVVITWRCRPDQPGINIITGYRVWRRAPAASQVRVGFTRIMEDFWEAVATLPAGKLVSYAYTSPTSQDSIAGSNPYTAFLVDALTSNANVFYRSAPDSGYSVDNLSPPTPAPFAAVYGPYDTALHWGSSSAPDLREFRLYRGLAPDFVPDASNLLVATRDTGYVDPDQRAYVYKLAAVDVHGNTSRYALVTPNGPIAVLASLASIEPAADRIRVTWYAPANPGLTATVYRRTATSDWISLGMVTADAQGYLPYLDTSVELGQRYGYRLGIMDGENEVFAGEAWATAGTQQVFALEGVRPNPAVGGDLTVFFSLPRSGSARLELLDVSGRRMASREVGSLGPGPHNLSLASAATLPPGIYLVRLTQGEKTLVTRAAVLK